jgi:adenine-specific DNA-methyltransferase
MGYRYIGAKTRLIPELIRHLGTLVPDGSLIADLMCGTAAVAGALRRKGFRVVANDVMTYSVHHARVELLFSEAPVFKGAGSFVERFLPAHTDELWPMNPYERIVRALNAVPPRKGYFFKEFSIAGTPTNATKPRNYFVPDNAAKIDSLRFWIKQLKAKRAITELEHSLLVHDLIMAANDIANIAGTYGHYLNRTVGRAHTPIVLSPTPLFIQDDKGRHEVRQGYAEHVASELTCDLCYIDPPYMKRQYAANYHLLETIAREDNPPAIGESGLRPWRDQYSNFCTKTKIHSAFEQIVTRANCPLFVISYSEDGLLPVEDLNSFLKRFGDVTITTVRNKRFKSNESTLAPEIREYFVTLEITVANGSSVKRRPARRGRVPDATLSCGVDR